jgi:glycosyltransferase involved in cell wall biosynthesis
MKIALVGPSYPYRGGIAHHTNMLYLHLVEQGHTVDVITFSRQYPKRLYPGQFQEEGEEGGFAGKIPSERLIDSMNPITWYTTGRELRRRGYDIIIIRFWIPLFGLAFGTIARGGHHRGKKDIMILLDNLLPHEPRPGDRLMTNFLFRYCNLAVTQSSTVSRQFHELFPEIPETMLPHPVDENVGEAIPKEEVQRELGLEGRKVLLFFGFVRRYKGLDRLLEAMPEIVRRVPEAHLLVVGEFFDDPEEYQKIISENGMEDRVTIHNIYVPNDEVARWFSAADLLVLPYRSATNSGIVQIGYNFALPAVVTDVGSLAEVVIDGVTGYVVRDAEPATLANAVAAIYNGDTLARFAENIVVERRKFSWEAFVEGLERFVGQVQSGKA